MHRVLLAAAAALPLMTGPSRAEPTLSTATPQGTNPASPQTAPSCLEWPVAMVAAQVNNPDASLVKLMDGAMAGDFIRVVNALPPSSEFEGNHVALFFKAKDD